MSFFPWKERGGGGLFIRRGRGGRSDMGEFSDKGRKKKKRTRGVSYEFAYNFPKNTHLAEKGKNNSHHNREFSRKKNEKKVNRPTNAVPPRKELGGGTF